MIKYSIIIPVYNRPEELCELLDSLTLQRLKGECEVIVIDDGSTRRCALEVDGFKSQLNIIYAYQLNMGPSGARNTGAMMARGEYLLFFDSDCVLPSDYLVKLDNYLSNHKWIDCFGGADKEGSFFTPTQSSIAFSMSSFLTTGGIRGGTERVTKFYPRSFNMGVRREVFFAVKGFSSDMRYGEDVDFSMRVEEAGYHLGLCHEAKVYHKRRGTYREFFVQVFHSGEARVELTRRHRGSLRLTHLFPLVFLLGMVVGVWLRWLWIFYIMYGVLLWASGTHRYGSFGIGFRCMVAGYVQLTGYGCGLVRGVVRR